MASFFARPILEDLQFKQIPGSVLTLSGQTQISTLTGLTLANGSGGTIAINASGASFGNVMTYDGTQIRLMPPTASGGSGIYTCASPTTCTVGGLVAGTPISGCTISQILQEILVPTLYPTLTPPSASLSLTPSTLLYEVGCNLTITATTVFDRGCINPQYTALSDKRVGTATCYAFSTFSGGYTSGVTNNVVNAGIIGIGANNFGGIVAYNAGVQPKDSSGGNYLSACPAGNIITNSISALGIYPWFYGKSVSAPVVGQALINGGSKCVGVSTGAICVANYAASSEYVWFAIPTGSTSKTCWQGANNISNNGVIPGPLFPTVTCMVISSPSGCWSNVGYKFYIGGYPTSINYGMTFCN